MRHNKYTTLYTFLNNIQMAVILSRNPMFDSIHPISPHKLSSVYNSPIDHTDEFSQFFINTYCFLQAWIVNSHHHGLKIFI